MLDAGILVVFLGLFFTASLAGAFFGIPLILFGSLLFIYGLASK
jgi:hypothetical protein